MKIIFFTNKCSHGAELLSAIKNQKIPLEMILIEKAGSKKLIPEAQKIVKRDGYLELFRQVGKKILNSVVSGSVPAWKLNNFYDSFSDQVICVDDFNGLKTRQLLEKIRPDLVVLGGSRILKERIIRIPRLGILNAHPGLLPKTRGVDVIPWAILDGDDVGVTIHFIDAGIDTGRICAREMLHIEAGDTIQSLRRKAEKVAASLVAQTLLTIVKQGNIDTITNPHDAGKQYFKISRRMLKQAEKKLLNRQRNAKDKL